MLSSFTLPEKQKIIKEDKEYNKLLDLKVNVKNVANKQEFRMCCVFFYLFIYLFREITIAF